MITIESLWEFSLRTYGQAGVAEACLALQDHHGADVNMLLYCCWAGACHGELDEADFERAHALSANWSKRVVRPLRELRRWMKAGGCRDGRIDIDACMSLRESVKEVELGAEKIQQQALESMSRAFGDPKADRLAPAGAEAARANLRRYCEAAQIPRNAEVQSKLRSILKAALRGEEAGGPKR